MKFIAKVEIMPRPELLDPQGKAVLNSLGHLNVAGVRDVRVGRLVSLTLEADNEAQAREKVETASAQLLANPIVETYTYALEAV